MANAALALWDFDAWDAVSTRHVELRPGLRCARPAGQRAERASGDRAVARRRRAARALGLEEQTVKEVTGTRRASYGDLFLLAYQGHAAEAAPLLAADAERGDRSRARASACRSPTGRPRCCTWVSGGTPRRWPPPSAPRRATWARSPAQALPDLIEAAVRSGEPSSRRPGAAPADDVHRRRRLGLGGRSARPARARWSATASEAERGYAEAVERLGRTRLRFELARTRLLYGEWLRRERRRADARSQLHVAFEEFAAMGADGFAERARHELLATGEKVRKRDGPTPCTT